MEKLIDSVGHGHAYRFNQDSEASKTLHNVMLIFTTIQKECKRYNLIMEIGYGEKELNKI